MRRNNFSFYSLACAIYPNGTLSLLTIPFYNKKLQWKNYTWLSYGVPFCKIVYASLSCSQKKKKQQADAFPFPWPPPHPNFSPIISISDLLPSTTSDQTCLFASPLNPFPIPMQSYPITLTTLQSSPPRLHQDHQNPTPNPSLIRPTWKTAFAAPYEPANMTTRSSLSNPWQAMATSSISSCALIL